MKTQILYNILRYLEQRIERRDYGGLYSHPKRTNCFKQCELLFNQNKLLTYGYERNLVI